MRTPLHRRDLLPGSGFEAFTLVEMMIVVALIAILSALIIPEMKGTYEDVLLRGTSRELVNAFNLASSRAVSLNQPCRVRLDLRNSRYFIEGRTAKNGRGLPGFVPLAGIAGAQGELDPRISIRIRPANDGPREGSDTPNEGSALSAEPSSVPIAEADTIAFYADGTADGTEVMLRDRAGFELLLRINPITARVRIIESSRAPALGE